MSVVPNDRWKQKLARELANEALFDEGVEAARNACVAGASIAAAVITAAAWYDNPLTGLPALRACMARLATLPFDPTAWRTAFARAPHPTTLDPDFSPGFGFVTAEQAEHVLDACRRIAGSVTSGPRACSAFFLEHHRAICAASGPLNHAGLAALVFVDHGTGPEEAERSFLLWRVETAVAEAQGARQRGVGAFPFFTEGYVYEGPWPKAQSLDMAALMKEVGLE
jgi:hypothetical protein